MNIFETIEKRRAIHDFIPGKKIEKEIFEKLVYYASLAPSGYNCQPWEFLVIENDQKKAKISEIAFNQKHILDASAVIVVLGKLNFAKDVDKISKQWLEYGYIKEEKINDFKNSMTRVKEYEKRKNMILRNVSLAIENLLLAAVGFGLGTCPMMGFARNKLSLFLNLDEDTIPVMIVAIGYEKEGFTKKRLPRKNIQEILFFENYNPNE